MLRVHMGLYVLKEDKYFSTQQQSTQQQTVFLK